VANEGMVGVSLFMGGDSMHSSPVVQTADHAYRLERRLLKQEFQRAGLLQSLLLTQTAQTALCNRHHAIEQQLCRWLLLTLDPLPTNELVMTQELVASIPGVRREGVTSYRRGHIAVLDRVGP
jgi:hypothetical protein